MTENEIIGDPSASAGIDRRQAIKRGVIVAGAAWGAPFCAPPPACLTPIAPRRASAYPVRLSRCAGRYAKAAAMSRSKRKTPIIGIAGHTDKPFKEVEHRRERRAVKVAIRVEADMPSPKRFGNPWSSCKDGKMYFEDRDPKWMRK